MLPQPSQCREWWVGFLLIAMITSSLEPKWKHFAQVKIADIFTLSSKLPKQNENVSKSREKSYGNLHSDSTQSSRSSSTFSFCVWAPVCATLACWQVSNATRRVLGLNQNGPCQVDLVLRWGWFGQRQTPPLLRWSREIPSWNAQSGMKTRKLCQVRSWKSSGATPPSAQCIFKPAKSPISQAWR